MKKSLIVGYALIGLRTLSAAPTLADDRPSPEELPTPVVVHQVGLQPAPSANTSSADTGRSRGNTLWTWGGIAMWGAAYSAAASAAVLVDDACDAGSNMCISRPGLLWAPVVGPFLAINRAQGKGSTLLKTLLAIDGAFQVGGVAIAATGIMASASAAAEKRAAEAPRVMLSPFVGWYTVGLGVAGHF